MVRLLVTGSCPPVSMIFPPESEPMLQLRCDEALDAVGFKIDDRNLHHALDDGGGP